MADINFLVSLVDCKFEEFDRKEVISDMLASMLSKEADFVEILGGKRLVYNIESYYLDEERAKFLFRGSIEIPVEEFNKFLEEAFRYSGYDVMLSNDYICFDKETVED